MSRPLEGYRVVDFSHVLAGPIATHYLCMQGAEVVKVESGKGDTMRNYGGEAFADGMGPSFISVNTGKRSVVLDLKRASHQTVARKLVAWADVVVENFRPGVMQRLGLDFATCKAIKPGIVYCSISGFGQSGPLRENPAIDQIIQSMSGMMELSGEPGSTPMRVGFPVVDTFTGLLASFAIVSVLARRGEKKESQYIDLAMLDAALVMMMSVAGPYLAAGVEPRKTGNVGYSKSPTADTFPTAEGDITIGAVRQDQFEALCRTLERMDLAQDARFADRKLRQQNAAALRDEVIRALAAHTAVEWEQRLNANGVAAGAVRTIPQALALEHLQHRNLTQPAGLHDSPQARVFRTGFLSGGAQAGTGRPAPHLGEHSHEVLAELGYDPGQIESILGEPAGALHQEGDKP
ncbi:CoA transferase [Caenimonas sedimenti]|uniref:CoA transferase n=1 Tax=Caenimonas sedimenti TaxID=2596921 RepID=A0A562ZLS4_9BURK|nr:CoA transferase [Caenimonas sedimenti]TWO69443.1 CoA transferase [Caenimonas sedimenti]